MRDSVGQDRCIACTSINAVSHHYVKEKLIMLQVLCLVSALTAVQSEVASRLQLRYSWKVLDWAYPDEKTREHAIRSGAFVPENALPVGMEVWRDKIFVTVPRWRNGES